MRLLISASLKAPAALQVSRAECKRAPTKKALEAETAPKRGTKQAEAEGGAMKAGRLNSTARSVTPSFLYPFPNWEATAGSFDVVEQCCVEYLLSFYLRHRLSLYTVEMSEITVVLNVRK